LSTLTKVLIVLLTVFSIFLCGIVVTYVANAENQRERADKLQRDYQSAKQLRNKAQSDRDEARDAHVRATEELKVQMSRLESTNATLSDQLNAVERENRQLVQDVANMSATVKVANETQTRQMDQAQVAQGEVTDLRADQTRLDKELKETNQVLLEKMSIIAQLDEKNKQLTEANQALETRLNQNLRQSGQATAAPALVTPTQGVALPTEAIAKNIDLDGRITELDLTNGLAAISIGTAAGVGEKMKFHVTRGQKFVCDIEILDVEADKAVGNLKRIQMQPQVGDTVTTNL
jgi:myosin heavy subunit